MKRMRLTRLFKALVPGAIVLQAAGCGPEEYKEALDLMPDLDLSAYLQCVLPLDQYRDAWNIFRERKHIKVLLSAGETQS